MGRGQPLRLMSDAPATPAPQRPLWRIGLGAALIALAVDQAAKLWLVHGYDLGRRGAVALTPFLDLILTWNSGISYGWFQTTSTAGQWLLLGVKGFAVVVLAWWMAHASTRIAVIGLGLIIGGAIGNAIDRLVYGAVVDFALLHVQMAGKTYYWYVFNLADAAIVAGVIGLLYDSVVGDAAVKAP